MRVLVGCEESGVVRRAFRNRGHDAWSCDLLPARDGSEFHIQDDVMKAISQPWDIIILHPPCTAIAVSGNAHYGRGKPKHHERVASLEWTYTLFASAVIAAKIGAALENPVGILNIPYAPVQYIQPYQFGHDASKRTGLWINRLPHLKIPPQDKWFPPRLINGIPRWGNQTDSGQNKLAPSPTRSRDRAETYSGIAEAMAESWGNL